MQLSEDLQLIETTENHTGNQKNDDISVGAVELSPTCLNTGTTGETFQQSEKQDSFRYIFNPTVF